MRCGIGLVLLAVMLCAPATVGAQSACVRADIAPARWQAPLTRQVTLHADSITIGEALDRLAAAAGIRFSYSADAVPLVRRVCVSYAGVSIGDVLTALLHGAGVELVVASAEHVVLAPVRAPAVPNGPDPEPAAVLPLEPVHVRGRSSDTPRGATNVNAIVIEGNELARRGSISLAEVLNGAVPGVWIWHDGGAGTAAAYGSMRGASSFRTTAPRVYIDGVEVANSQLLTRISPAAVERIEIIRGPQAAALYGANALSGVVRIITRRAHADGGSPLQYVQSGVGFTASDFAGRTTVSQDHAVGIVAGTATHSAGLNLSAGTLGEYAPGAAAQHISADAFGRLVGARSVVTATLRFLGERSGTASSPLLPDSLQQIGSRAGVANALSADIPSMRQYTAAISASFQPSARWSHTLTAGIDGYRLAEPTRAIPALSFDRALDGGDLLLGALRAGLRVSTLRHFQAGDAASGTLTLAAEHSLLRQQATHAAQTNAGTSFARQQRDRAGADTPPALAPVPAPARVDQVSSTTGLTAQSDVLLYDHLLLSGGIRLEHSGSPAYVGRWSALPMVAGAVLARPGHAEIRLRTAFGRAVRWPVTPAGRTAWHSNHPTPVLFVQQPEQHTGVEAGVDVSVEGAALHVTRFDQRASGVAQTSPPAAGPALRGGSAPRLAPSIGTIQNRGWELEASLARGPLRLAGTLALVDSRVRSLAAGYHGDLRAGDRMLAVPARVASVTASWTVVAWSAAVSAVRPADWINYDRLALLTDLAASAGQPLPRLRDYWRSYDGFIHLNATATRQLGQRFSLTLGATNLLDVQVGEPDNITVVPGRAFSLGIRATF